MSYRPAGMALARVALAGFLLRPVPASGAEGRYVIVRTDGSTMTLVAAPERKGDQLVGRLLQGNQLVSFPAAEVDPARTDAANRPQPTPAAKGSPPVLTRQTPVPTEGRLLKVSRADAERTLASSSGTGAGGGSALPSSAAPPEARGVSEAVDRNGHGEAWWQRKATPARSRLARSEADLEKAVSARDAHERSPGFGTPAWQLRFHKLNQAIEKAQARVEGDRRSLERLADDARKAGAYPGWLR